MIPTDVLGRYFCHSIHSIREKEAGFRRRNRWTKRTIHRSTIYLNKQRVFNNPAKVDLERYIYKEMNAFKYLTRYTENVSQRVLNYGLSRSINLLIFFIQNIVRNFCRQDDIFRRQRKVIGMVSFRFIPISQSSLPRYKDHETIHAQDNALKFMNGPPISDTCLDFGIGRIEQGWREKWKITLLFTRRYFLGDRKSYCRTKEKNISTSKIGEL